jgi:hypothetical protein
VGCDAVCFRKWIPPQAEECAAFTFNYSKLYPIENEDSMFLKNNLNQKNNEELKICFMLKTPSKSLLLYDRIFKLMPSSQGLC